MIVNKIIKVLKEHVESKGFILIYCNDACGIRDKNDEGLTTIHFDTMDYWGKNEWESFTFSDPNIIDKLKKALDSDMDRLHKYAD